MAIQNYCLSCRTSNLLEAKKCKKCGVTFGRDNRQYRVDVTVKGRRLTRMADNLTIAREIESTVKSDMVREEFDVSHHKSKQRQLTLGDFWEKHYLPWA
jgi:hypothetical protein